MELSLQTLIFLLVTGAVGAAVIMFLMGQWLELTGLRYRMETQRNALNLLQVIVSNSPIVHEIPDNEPEKLVLDRSRLVDYVGMDMYDKNTLLSNFRRMEWEECCEFHNLDYKLTVIDVEDPNNRWEIGELPFKTDDKTDPNDGSKCYAKRIRAYADMPVVIFPVWIDMGIRPGFINITITQTPLSDLSFWLSQAFVRAHWTSQDVFYGEHEVMVPIDPEIEVITVDRTNGLVCLTFRVGGREACKPFTAHDDVTLRDEAGSPQDQISITNPRDDLCRNVWIVTNQANNEVVVK